MNGSDFDALAKRLAARSSGRPRAVLLSDRAVASSTAAPATDGGGPAPPFVLPDLDGHAVSLAELLAPGRPVLLVFTDPHCTSCPQILPDLARWQQTAGLTVAVISTGNAAANRDLVASHGLETVLLQHELEVVTAYGLEVAPAAVVIRPDGSRAGPPTYGPHAIRQLGGQLVGETPPPPASVVPPLAVGDTAPPLHGQGLDGQPLDLAAFRGTPLAVLFWNPACAYCQGLVSQIRAWAAASAEVPPLLLVARGTAEANRALGLPVPLLLDPDLELAQAWGVGGTPWAYLLDEAGRVAAPLARGAIAVLALVAQANSSPPAVTAIDD